MIQLVLFIWGIFILVKHRVSLTKRKVVQGRAAVAIGTIFVLVLPVGFVVGLVLGLVMAALQVPSDSFFIFAVMADGALIVAAVVAAIIISSRYGGPAEEPAASLPAAAAPFAPPADPSNPFNPPRA